MAHYLVIKGPDGSILATLPVPSGYQVIETTDEKVKEMNKLLPPDKQISLEDFCKAKEKSG